MLITPDTPRTRASGMARWQQTPIDDLTQRYIVQAQPLFNALLDAVRQMAALLILHAAGAGRKIPGHPMMSALREELAELREQFEALRPGLAASHFHRHLRKAIHAMGESVCASANLHRPPLHSAAADAALVAIKSALKDLSWAARALPGFETVAIGESCCAECRSTPAVGHFSNLILEKHKG